MQKILFFLLICSPLFASAKENGMFSSSGLHSEFSIHQDPCKRVFYIKANDELLGIVLSSARGRFDFYDKEQEMRWSNSYDNLFDDSGNQIGELVWKKDPETEKWFWERKWLLYRHMSYISVYVGFVKEKNTFKEQSEQHEIPGSDKKELLMTFHPYCQGNDELFVFSDGQTKQPLAIAYWFWTTGGWFSSDLQNWQIYIIDRPRLQERNISDVFLTWVLLKHSQDHFPFGPDQYDYVKALPRG